MRLIDADEFGEMLEAYGELDGAALLKDYPIAYDVDKVIERLEVNSMFARADDELFVMLDDAIQIVRSGGVR